MTKQTPARTLEKTDNYLALVMPPRPARQAAKRGKPWPSRLFWEIYLRRRSYLPNVRGEHGAEAAECACQPSSAEK